MRAQAFLPFPRPVAAPAAVPFSAPLNPQFRKLRESLGARVSSGTELIHAIETKRRPAVPTMLAPFDRVLGSGLPRGKLVELTGRRSSGRFAICQAALAAATGSGEAAALVDLGDHLDPQIARSAGVELPRLLWVRPKTMKEAVAAAEMLIATGFPLVVMDLGIRVQGRRVGDASWVRLARAAESYGSALLVCSPFHIAGTAAEALVSAAPGPAVWKGKGKSPRLLTGIESILILEKHRRAITGRSEPLHLRYEEAIVTMEPLQEEHRSEIEEVAAISA